MPREYDFLSASECNFEPSIFVGTRFCIVLYCIVVFHLTFRISYEWTPIHLSERSNDVCWWLWCALTRLFQPVINMSNFIASPSQTSNRRRVCLHTNDIKSKLITITIYASYRQQTYKTLLILIIYEYRACWYVRVCADDDAFRRASVHILTHKGNTLRVVDRW